MSSKNTHMGELTANGDVDQVEARLREALDAHGLQLFARIDHAAGARTCVRSASCQISIRSGSSMPTRGRPAFKADVELEANVLLIFGNTSVVTPCGVRKVGQAA
jgi:hypothetical protein